MQFDPELHAYSVNGTVLPSVTQILEDVGIIDYSQIPSETQEEALARGRRVHIATQYDDEGELDDSTVAESDLPYLEAWRKFRAESGFTPSLIEYRSYNSTHGFAGTLDRTGWYGSNGRGADVLLDVKSGSAENWVRLQLSAYCSFFPSPRSFRRVCVELRKDGSYRTYEFPCREWESDFNRFLAALEVYRMKREEKRVRV